MKRKHFDHTFAAFCFLAGMIGIISGLAENEWELQGTLAPLAATFLFCVNVHFRLARIEKESAS
ncbi:MAG: hypothetical protein VB855_02390 [Pirellulaceae bacterium]